MDTWYKVTLSSKDITAGKHMALQSTFPFLFLASRAPRDAAMLTNSEPRFPADYFFSPGAVRFSKTLIDGFSSIECAAPKATGLSLLVGDEQLEAIPFSK